MPDSPERPSRRTETTGATVASLTGRALPSNRRTAIAAVLAVVGGVAVLAGLVLRLFTPELRGSAYTVLAIGGIMLLASLMMSFTKVRETIIGRRGRYSTNTVVMIIAFIAIAILVQLVSVRNSPRWDTTATRQFTLAPQTVEVLKNLKDPIQAIAFFVPGSADQDQYRIPTEGLLNELQHRSGGKFSYRFVDPDIQSSLAKQYNVTQYPTVVFENQTTYTQHQLASPLFQERDFASAFLIVTGTKRKLIYYLQGHKERDLNDRAGDSHQGLGFADSSLSTENYDVLPFSIIAAENPSIPVSGENAVAAVIIAGPGQDLIEKEIIVLEDYLKKGGRLLLLLEPDPPKTYKDLLARWAVTIDDGLVIDIGSNVNGQSQTPLIRRGQYPQTPPVDAITKPLDQTYFPGTASFRQSLPPEEMPDYIGIFPLVTTTILSCLAPNPEITDCQGRGFSFLVPAIAVVATAPLNEKPLPGAAQITKIVAFGDTDFATNFHHFSQSNSDMLLNSVNWLTEDISLASVRPKPFAFRFLVVTGREMQIIRGLSWVVLPGVMTLLAAVAWWRRR